MKKLFLLVLLCLLLVGCVARTAVAAAEFPPWTDFQAVLLWLTGVGAPYLVGAMLSYIAANWKFWETLPRNVKFIVPIIVSVLIAAGAQYALTMPVLISTAQPYWSFVISAVLAYLGSQTAYANIKRAGYGVKYDGKPQLRC